MMITQSVYCCPIGRAVRYCQADIYVIGVTFRQPVSLDYLYSGRYGVNTCTCAKGNSD